MKRLLTVVLVAGLSLTRVGPAAAFSAQPTKPIEELLDSNDPYQAFDIVAGYNLERTRRVGFAHCLPEVLVRVSGEPQLEHDPGLWVSRPMPMLLSPPTTIRTL